MALLALWTPESPSLSAFGNPVVDMPGGQIVNDPSPHDRLMELPGGRFVKLPGKTGGESEVSGSGTLKLEFAQQGEAAEATLVARDFPDGGHFVISVTADGRIAVSQETDGDEHRFETEAAFFTPGDAVRVTYSWDAAGGGGFCAENLTTGAVHTEPVPDIVSMGLNDPDAPWVVGNDDGEEDGLDGDIGYVALWDRVEPPGPLEDDIADRPEYEASDEETDTPSEDGDSVAEGSELPDVEEDSEEPREDDGLPEGGDGGIHAEDGGEQPAADVFDSEDEGAGGAGDGFRGGREGEDGDGEVRDEAPAGNDPGWSGNGSGEGDDGEGDEDEGAEGDGGEAPGLVSLTFELSSAAFQNTLGYYFIDPDTGEIAGVGIAFEDARSEFAGGDLIPGATDARFEVPPGAKVGAFLIANGGGLNDYADLGEGTLKFVSAEGGPATLQDSAPQLVHVALDGTETVLQGDIWHSAAHGDNVGLNSDGAVHVRGIAENDDGTWTFGFEDLASPGWDGDFTDVVFTVDTGGTEAAFLNPDFDTTAALAEDDFFSEEDDDDADELEPGDEDDDSQPADDDPEDEAEDDELLADDGDWVEEGGTGRLIELGDGDDTVLGGPGDTIIGSPGHDTLILDGQKDNILKIDFTASTENEDGTTSRDGTVSFKDGSPDLIFEDIEKIVPCFTPGTLIETDEGRVPVEELLPGDRVLTRDHGYRALEWVGHKLVTAELLAARPEFTPVRIARGALGDGLPERDMLVSPQHRMLMTGPRAELLFGTHEVLVPAKHMIGMHGITRAHGELVTYIHIMCDRHEIVRADGAWSESFQPGDLSLAGLDDDQRGELLALFPELATPLGQRAYGAARMSLKAHEVRALLTS